EISDLDGLQGPCAGFQRAPRQRQAERTGKHFRIKGEDGSTETHRLPPASFGPRGRCFPLPSRAGLLSASGSLSSSSTSPAATGSTVIYPPARESWGQEVLEMVISQPRRPTRVRSRISPPPKLWTAATLPIVAPESSLTESPIRSA